MSLPCRDLRRGQGSAHGRWQWVRPALPLHHGTAGGLRHLARGPRALRLVEAPHPCRRGAGGRLALATPTAAGKAGAPGPRRVLTAAAGSGAPRRPAAGCTAARCSSGSCGDAAWSRHRSPHQDPCPSATLGCLRHPRRGPSGCVPAGACPQKHEPPIPVPAAPRGPGTGTHRVVSWLMLVKDELLRELILLLLRSLENTRGVSARSSGSAGPAPAVAGLPGPCGTAGVGAAPLPGRPAALLHRAHGDGKGPATPRGQLLAVMVLRRAGSRAPC